MFLGGLLIRRFDGFRRLCRRAGEAYGHPVIVSDGDLMLTNRVLAALGGPPAAPQVRGRLRGDTLSLLLLFLITQDLPCKVGVVGPVLETDRVMAGLKSLVHLLAHGVYPMVTEKPPLDYHDAVETLSATEAVLHPLMQYAEDGEPAGLAPFGGSGSVTVGPADGPYTLLVTFGEEPQAGLLFPSDGTLHPASLVVPAR